MTAAINCIVFMAVTLNFDISLSFGKVLYALIDGGLIGGMVALFHFYTGLSLKTWEGAAIIK